MYYLILVIDNQETHQKYFLSCSVSDSLFFLLYNCMISMFSIMVRKLKMDAVLRIRLQQILVVTKLENQTHFHKL